LRGGDAHAISAPACEGPSDEAGFSSCCLKHFKPLAGATLAAGPDDNAFSRTDPSVADDFRTTDVGERYAQALFDLALETGRLDAVRADLKSLKAAWIESADLRRLATSPVMASDDQVKGLVAIATEAKFEPTIRNFLGLLAQNGRARDLPGVIAGFETRYAKHTGSVAAEVVSAVALSAAQSKAIRTALVQALGKEPELTARVDPSILGGLKVKVGSKLFDASLKTKLDQMKFALKRA
jgi:F-type H+-transporting ATPase subunit delta